MSNITPDNIMRLGLGFWGAKALLSAVEIGVFTELAKAPADRSRTDALRIQIRTFRIAAIASRHAATSILIWT